MSSSASILMRDDTMFGVCQALGEDLGLPPTLLRILFALVLFWSPVAALAGYGLAGLLVALSRWLVPEPVAAAEPEAARAAAANDDLQEQAQAWEELARAA